MNKLNQFHPMSAFDQSDFARHVQLWVESCQLLNLLGWPPALHSVEGSDAEKKKAVLTFCIFFRKSAWI